MRRLPDVRCRDASASGQADSAITPTSPTAPKRDSRRSILDAAAHIIRTKGAGAATLREIADAAGIKPGSIYYHFASKDEILAAVAEKGDFAPEQERDSRRAILDATARILRTKGYHATTLREIAAVVGIKSGSIYYHFASKDEIIAAVMNDGVDHVREEVERTLAALPAAASPEQRLEAAIRSHLHALLEYSDYTSAGLKAYGDAPEFVRVAAQSHRRQYEDLWRRLVEELIRSGHVPTGISGEALRLAILGVMNWSPEWYRPSKHAIDDLARQFAALFSRRAEDTRR